MHKYCQYCGKELAEGIPCACRETQSPPTPAQPPIATDAQTVPGAQPPPHSGGSGFSPNIPPPGSPTYNPPPEPPTYNQPPQPGAHMYNQQGYYPGGPQMYAGGPPPPPPAPNPTAQMVKGLANTGLATVKTFFTAPSATMAQNNSDAHFVQGLFFYAVKALAMGLMSTVVASNFYSVIVGRFSRGLSFGNCLGIFFKALLFSAVADGVFYGAVLLCGKIFKSGATPKSLLGVLGVSTIPMTLTIVVTGLLLALNLQMGICVLIILLCLCASVNYRAVGVSLGIPEDKLVYANAIVAAVTAIIFLMYAGRAVQDVPSYITSALQKALY